MSLITIYTDGSSRGNPGKGGYAALLRYGRHYKEINGAYEYTTNNRMELIAVIKALEEVKKKDLSIKIHTDSHYIVSAYNQGWLDKWIKNGFKKIKNEDLWRKFWTLSKKFILEIVWVKGHSGDPQNERCDYLAVYAAENGPWLIDSGYCKDENDDLSLPIKKELIDN